MGEVVARAVRPTTAVATPPSAVLFARSFACAPPWGPSPPPQRDKPAPPKGYHTDSRSRKRHARKYPAVLGKWCVGKLPSQTWQWVVQSTICISLAAAKARGVRSGTRLVPHFSLYLTDSPLSGYLYSTPDSSGTHTAVGSVPADFSTSRSYPLTSGHTEGGTSMQNRLRCLMAATVGAILCIAWTAVLAQTRTPAQAECQTLRERLLDHTNLSQGVRRELAAYAARYMAAPQAAAKPSRDARLEEIAREQQQLDDQRMAAFGRLDFTRAMQLQEQIRLSTKRRSICRNSRPNPSPRHPQRRLSPRPSARQRSSASRVPRWPHSSTAH